MVLAFAFNYVSQNGVLENLLQSICKDFDISYSIIKKDSIVTLYVEDEAEQLEEFSNFLAKRLPLSIFFKSSNVEVVETAEETQEVFPCTIVLPFTPKALESVKDEKSSDYMNPFVKNEIGLSPFDASSLSFELTGEKMSAKTSMEYEKLFSSIAEAIKDGKSIQVNTASGNVVLSKLNKKTKKQWHEGMMIMPTDLSFVEKMVVAKENEIKALASLEKPSLQMRLNTIFRAKEILPFTRVKVQLADDMLLHLLSEALYDVGLEFVYKEFDSSKQADGTLHVEGLMHKIPAIEVVVLENGEILITKGDGYSAKSLKDNLKKFEIQAHAQFSSIVQEHHLFDKACTCYYFSKKHDDMVMHLSKETGLIELVKFPFKSSVEKIFDEIKSSQTGEKLVENYKENFPDIYSNAQSVNLENLPKNMYTIWGVAAVILGIADDIQSGSQRVLELAEDFGGQRGPRIDYFKLDEKSLYTEFNLVKMIRSAMSFKLAGTDDITLSYGILESLSYFISDSSDFYKESFSNTHILMAGALFGSKRLTESTCKNLINNHKIAFNQELPIDN